MKNIRPANFDAAAVVELVELMLATIELVTMEAFKAWSRPDAARLGPPQQDSVRLREP